MSKDNTRCVCPTELAGSLDSRLRQWLHNPETILAPYIRKGMTVLDQGCGPGFFIVQMAHLVGDFGRVIASDLQPYMLERARQKVKDTELEKRILFHQCQPDRIGLTEQADFILLFYVVHESPDKVALFKELATILKPDGQILMAEPPIHVSKSQFQASIDIALKNGFNSFQGPKIFLTKTAILKRV
ncbi:MAG: class I SAM-dependent methyltransferase [Pseudomonadota bacterium]